MIVVHLIYVKSVTEKRLQHAANPRPHTRITNELARLFALIPMTASRIRTDQNLGARPAVLTKS
ncbi:hypothetical protein [Paraburkholderia sp. MM5477-R1]|uniref:hypothetical protein n=1 Tax=Paraburkholderia sp. MM5477-R1 TaxID=2991062 RepID=UPI003D23AFCB